MRRIDAGGLLVVPAAPALKDLASSVGYREALLGSDLVLPDSAFMVMVWNLRMRDRMPRVSGLEYLRLLLREPEVRRKGNTMWVMAGAESERLNLRWLAAEGVEVPAECVYRAPMYGPVIEDAALLALLERLRPHHVVLTIGGGNQERLGLYLKRNLSYLPAIHCIGAAIAFLSGDQVHIPAWADRFYLGWLLRCVSEPRRYAPRYWGARKLLGLMLRHGEELPPLGGG